jgi:hypothetical protein
MLPRPTSGSSNEFDCSFEGRTVLSAFVPRPLITTKRHNRFEVPPRSRAREASGADGTAVELSRYSGFTRVLSVRGYDTSSRCRGVRQ